MARHPHSIIYLIIFLDSRIVNIVLEFLYRNFKLLSSNGQLGFFFFLTLRLLLTWDFDYSVSMVGRRSPLVLSSTRATLRSVVNSLQPVSADGNLVQNKDGILGRSDLLQGNVRLSAGILRWHRDGKNVSDAKLDSLDDSSLVGLSTQLLKRLSINSGSLVSIWHF